MKTKRLLSAVLSAAFALNIIPVSLVHASAGADETELRDRLRNGLMGYQSEISILDCGVSYSAEETTSLLQNMIFSILDEPDMFYVNFSKFTYSVTSDGSGGYLLKSIKGIEYVTDQQSGLEYYEQFRSEAEKIISSTVKPGMTDLEKALVLHDYLVLNSTYDLYGTMEDLNEGYSAYDIIVKKNGVCQGYALAYQYLLGMVGVESKVVKSEDMCHGWNLVKINDNWYHVDVTWDDPIPDTPGRVKHSYFMLSDDAISKKSSVRTSEHYNWDSDGIKATDTSFDNMFWNKVDTEMFILDGNWYFIDSKGEYSTYVTSRNEVSTFVSLYEEPWYVWGEEESATWTGKYTSLIISGDTVYFNTPKMLYSMRLDGSEKRGIQYINPYENDGYCYGLAYQNDAIYAVVKQAPNKEGKLVKIMDIHFDSYSYIDAMLKKIEEMQDGESSVFDLSEEKILPAKAVELIKDRNVEITLECDEDYSWAINGQNVRAVRTEDVNLSVDSNLGIIPEEKIGSHDYVELNLAEENDLEFTAEINYNIGERFAGKTASIYSYDKITDTIIKIDDASVDSDGMVIIPVSDSVNYAVVIEEKAPENDNNGKVLDGNENFPEIISAVGDIDNSKEIDLVDLTMLSQYLLNDISFSEEQIDRADVTGDGAADVSDLALLKQYVMNDQVSFRRV